MRKQVIKISTPYDTLKIRSQVNHVLLEKYIIEVNTNCRECDYWIIWGDLPEIYDRYTVRCNPEHVFYMTDEAYVEKKFDSRFLSQFAAVITCRKDITHRNLIASHEINIWQLDYSFEDIIQMPVPEKKGKISVVCSDKLFLDGHKKRFAFVNRLVGHFKDRLDAYGTAFKPVKDKWEAIAPYQYSIAVENSSLPGYFTEKITECYLSNTFPVYYGAPDIDSFFDPDSYRVIDRDDYLSAIRTIEELLESDSWEKSRQLLTEQRELFLSTYHFFPALIRVLSAFPTSKLGRQKAVTLKSHRSFTKNYQIIKWYLSAKRFLPTK